MLWFLHGDTNIRFLLQHHNHIWDEWAFERWVESPEYTGPDMTDFGRRRLKDADFAKVYQAQMQAFDDRILADETFAKKYGTLGNVYGKQWRAWATSRGDTIDQLGNVIAAIKKNAELPAPDCLGVEPGGRADHGAAAVPHAVPVLRQ